MAKEKGVRLTKSQQGELLSMLFFGYPKSQILRRFKERWDITVSADMFKYWKGRADEKADEAVKRFEERVFEKYLSQREVRLDILMGQVDKALAIECDPDDPLSFQRINKEVRETLQQIATELNEWRTGDTYNIVYNVVSPVFEVLAMWAVRHISQGPERELALSDLRRITEGFLKELPDGKEIATTAKTIKR